MKDLILYSSTLVLTWIAKPKLYGFVTILIVIFAMTKLMNKIPLIGLSLLTTINGSLIIYHKTDLKFVTEIGLLYMVIMLIVYWVVYQIEQIETALRGGIPYPLDPLPVFQSNHHIC
jgi:hypothetical protein